MLTALFVNGSLIEMFFSRLYIIYVLWDGIFNSKFQWANKCVKFEPQLLLEGKEKGERYIWQWHRFTVHEWLLKYSEKILSDSIPIGNYLHPVQFQSVSTNRYTCRIKYMNTCSMFIIIYHFIIMILSFKCWKFVSEGIHWPIDHPVNTNILYMEEVHFKSLSRKHRNYQ